MGYKRPSKTYRLTFEDEPGLEVMAGSVPLGQLLDIMQLADKMTGAPDKNTVNTLFGWFGDRIKSWNLEDEDGTAVPAAYAACRKSGLNGTPGEPCPEHNVGDDPPPCDYNGLCAQDFDFALRLVLAWVQAVSSVAAPLVTTSTATTPTSNPLEATIPMGSPAGM